MGWAENALEFDDSLGVRRETQLFQVIARLCSLRSIVHRSNPSSIDDPTVLGLAKDIDTDLANYANAFPDAFKPKAVSCQMSENILSDFYHVYPNSWIIGAWNLYRSARVMTHELILHWLSKNPEYENNNLLRRESEILLLRLSADICASVPFILGEVESADGTRFLPRAIGGLGIVWPLYLAATMDTTSESTRAWVITRLDRLGHVMGIQLAVSLAHVLKTKKEITAWDRFESTRIDEEIEEW